MPIIPMENEDYNKFLKRCILTEIESGRDRDSAIAICINSFEEKSKIKKEFQASIIKIDDSEEKQVVTGIVLEPDRRDSQGDIISIEEIEKACYYFMLKSRVIGDSHESYLEDADIVENYIAPVDFFINENQVIKGSWIMSVKILNSDLWEKVKNGYYTGFSVGGYGIREEE